MKRIICALLVFAVAGFGACAPAGAQEIDKFRIIAPVTRGIEGGSFSDLINRVSVVMSEETGYEFEYREIAYRMGDEEGDLVYEAFRNGEAEIGFMSSVEYVEKLDKWEGIFQPGFTMKFNGSKHHEECMYVREEDGIEELEDLRGMTWGGSRIYSTRYLLYLNGIDEPLADFFGETVYIDDAPLSRSVQALQSGKIDCFVGNRHHLEIGGGSMPMNKSDDKPTLKYETVACEPGEMHWIFLFHKDIPREIVRKITGTLVMADKNQAFNDFRFIFYAIKGGFVPLEKHDLERTKEIAKLKATQGWNEERAALLKKRPPEEE